MLAATLKKLHDIFYQQDVQKSFTWIDAIAETDALEVLRRATDQLITVNFDANKMHTANIDAVIAIDKKLHYIRKHYLTIYKSKNHLDI